MSSESDSREGSPRYPQIFSNKNRSRRRKGFSTSSRGREPLARLGRRSL